MTLNESETENVVHEPKVKKNRMTKIIFYIMAILLTATTALSIYTTYNMNILRDQMTDVAAMDTSASASSGNQTEQINIPDDYTLISNEQLEAVKMIPIIWVEIIFLNPYEQ